MEKATKDCSSEREARDTAKALTLKLIAIAAILSAGAGGVLIPILGDRSRAMSPESDVFFVIHILPDAFESLTSPCLGEQRWQDFPVAWFIAMSSPMVTLAIDSFATSYYEVALQQGAAGRGKGRAEDMAMNHVHTHATRCHAHGSEEASLSDNKTNLGSFTG
ncbi:zinc transporter [Musa troglodytarum]|uniref:Zinc transporter n=1 Tax=Musa troglodytarum TaxID=320322 RepID=A0A9E7KRZ3_9LILI|nr:zinc transporter [Musa troglodytarum]